MSNVERLEAIGSRGEAVIIIIRKREFPEGAGDTAGLEGASSYELATGERLQATDDDRVFETRDGRRQFTLR